MSTEPEVFEAFYQRFVSEWDDATPYVFDEAQLNPPDGPSTEGGAWARFTVRLLDAGPETLGQPGNRKYERKGSAFVQIMTVPGQPEAERIALRSRARVAFEGRQLPPTNVRINEVISRNLGVDREGVWYLSTIEAKFEYDEII